MKLITMGQCKAKSITDFRKQLHSGRKIVRTIKHKGPVITSHSSDPRLGSAWRSLTAELLSVLHTIPACVTAHQCRGHTGTGGHRAVPV